MKPTGHVSIGWLENPTLALAIAVAGIALHAYTRHRISAAFISAERTDSRFMLAIFLVSVGLVLLWAPLSEAIGFFAVLIFLVAAVIIVGFGYWHFQKLVGIDTERVIASTIAGWATIVILWTLPRTIEPHNIWHAITFVVTQRAGQAAVFGFIGIGIGWVAGTVVRNVSRSIPTEKMTLYAAGFWAFLTAALFVEGTLLNTDPYSQGTPLPCLEIAAEEGAPNSACRARYVGAPTAREMNFVISLSSGLLAFAGASVAWSRGAAHRKASR